ncbi:hypothetical protein RhiJN_19683 [Ceratobasidium sp. AG-Ba]|nr:hypothetical protein RhiJN_04853 [Ceratobasidium sp. AG-Ba]QRV91665.1 hypothetical protein RhiJN_19683 [Ceratobasidium sp. AG-Ba]
MFALARLLAFVALLVAAVSAMPLNVRQNQTQGQPINAGRPVDHSSEASGTFGTTSDAVNWTSTPTGLCIVPSYANEAGMGKEKTPMTTQQAMDLCPRAARIAVHKD